MGNRQKQYPRHCSKRPQLCLNFASKKTAPLPTGDSLGTNTTSMRIRVAFCHAETLAAATRHDLPQQRYKARPIQQKLPGDIDCHPQRNANRKLQQRTNGQM